MLILVTLSAAAIVVAGPPSFEITRSTIDGGGVMRSTGGDFELSGTIGQHDARVMTGGEVKVTGGFWFGLPPTDCNDDGIVDILDSATFAACLSGPGETINASPCPCLDVDRDDRITLHDYRQLQSGFNGK